MMTASGWFLIGILLFVLEMMTPGGLMMLFFGIGAVVVGVLQLIFPLPFWAQGLVFAIVSTVTLFLFRKPCLEKFMRSSVETENEFIGKTAQVTHPITPDLPGKVEFNGSFWTAVADVEIPSGSPVEIVSQTNLTLKVKPLH